MTKMFTIYKPDKIKKINKVAYICNYKNIRELIISKIVMQPVLDYLKWIDPL